MSCDNGYNGNVYGQTCRQDVPYPQVSHESVPSLIDNLVEALYGGFYNPQTQEGYITKSVVNGRIVWNVPCDPNNSAEVTGIPRNPGEGLLCYMIRVFNYLEGTQLPTFVTLTGTQTLTNKTLTSPVINTPTGILATDIGAGAFGSGVTLPATQLTTGAIPSGVTLPATQLTTGAIPSGVTLPATQLTTGAIPSGVTLPATQLTTGAIPSGVTLPGSQVSSVVASATNVAGGSAGQVPYQSAANTTSFTAAGTATQALIGGTSPVWSTSTSDLKLKNSAKAWYRGTISGTTLTQAAAYGCTVSRTGTGAFTVTLSNNADANYVVVFSFTNSTSLFSYNYTISNSTTFTFNTYVMSVSGSTLNQTATDLTSINFVVYGN